MNYYTHSLNASKIKAVHAFSILSALTVLFLGYSITESPKWSCGGTLNQRSGKKCTFCIRHEQLAVILNMTIYTSVYHTVQVAVPVAEWKSTTSASRNWWQLPPMHVERLHQLKEGKQHKCKVQRSGCKVRASIIASRYGMQHNMQLQPPPSPP